MLNDRNREFTGRVALVTGAAGAAPSSTWPPLQTGTAERGAPPYSAAKAGLLEVTRSIAIQAGSFGIRCNAVAPGLVWSEFVEKHEERLQADAEATASRRHDRPEEIANVITFLASDESSYISGGAYLRP